MFECFKWHKEAIATVIDGPAIFAQLYGDINQTYGISTTLCFQLLSILDVTWLRIINICMRSS